MPTTRQDIDNFYEFATAQLQGEQAEWSLEQCVMRWRKLGADKTALTQPFPNGATLRDCLLEAGILGRGEVGPDDLATNPDYMQGFGET